MAAQIQHERVAVVRARQLRPLFAYLREERGHGGKKWLARRCGIEPAAYIYHIEQGTIPAPDDFLERAAQVLRVSVDEISEQHELQQQRQRAS